MKAKEYYKMIEETTTKDELLEVVNKIIDCLNEEAKELMKSRHVKTDRRLVAILREMNDKWNAISALFEKNHGISPLARNAFLRAWANQMPELKPYLKMRGVILE